MQERPAQGVPPDGIQGAAANKPLGETFLTRNRYPGGPAEVSPPPAAPRPAPPRGRLLTRVVLPVAIFIAAVGAIAWVVQYLPSRAGPPPDTNPDAKEKARTKLALKFDDPYQVADWEPERMRAIREQWKKEGKIDAPRPPARYAAEYEVSTDTRQDGGHYDFVFENPNDVPVALGVESMTCQCTSVNACFFTPAEWTRYQKFQAQKGPVERARLSAEDGFPWKALTVGDTTGLVVPAKAHGAVRVFWVGRGKRDPESVRLGVETWVSPSGKHDERQHTRLSLYIAYVHPVRFSTARLDVGPLGPQTSTLPTPVYCWSATRDDLQIKVRNSDPCFVYQATPLQTEAERSKLTTDLREQGVMTRVRSAYRIDVAVYESRENKQLDLGVFDRTLPVEITAGGEVLKPTLPVIHGRVQGDVRIVTIEDKGAIDLKVFKADTNTSVKAKLWAKPKAELVYESFAPPVLKLRDVTVNKRPADDVGEWVAWEVRFTVPSGLEPGSLPEDSALVLRVKDTPRRIRIPLHGTAGR